MRGPTQQLFQTHQPQKRRAIGSPHRAPKFCLETLADHLTNDARAATVHDQTTADQNDKGWNGLGNWRVHQVVINSADHDDGDAACRIHAGAAEPDAKGARNFTNADECGQ